MGPWTGFVGSWTGLIGSCAGFVGESFEIPEICTGPSSTCNLSSFSFPWVVLSTFAVDLSLGGSDGGKLEYDAGSWIESCAHLEEVVKSTSEEVGMAGKGLVTATGSSDV